MLPENMVTQKIIITLLILLVVVIAFNTTWVSSHQVDYIESKNSCDIERAQTRESEKLSYYKNDPHLRNLKLGDRFSGGIFLKSLGPVYEYYETIPNEGGIKCNIFLNWKYILFTETHFNLLWALLMITVWGILQKFNLTKIAIIVSIILIPLCFYFSVLIFGPISFINL